MKDETVKETTNHWKENDEMMSCTLGSRESLEGGVTNGEITLEA